MACCTNTVHGKANIMLIISSREFRQNQRLYFDKVDQGEQVIVQRGKDKSYALTPIQSDDVYFNAEMIDKMKEGVKEVESGNFLQISSEDELKKLLGL